MAFSQVTVQVPATTANLGPGFDCLGVALTLQNQFQLTRQPTGTASVEIVVQGEEAASVSNNPDNLIYQAFRQFYEDFGETAPPVKIEIKLGVPLSRGLGSSATAIVGGLLAANALAGSPVEDEDLLQRAIALEGHPDNIVPAFLGGCRLAVPTGKAWEIAEIPWSEQLIPVVAIPNFELSTKEARSVLPSQVSRDVAIFNASHLGLLIRAIETGRGDWLRTGMQDQLHQPYRQQLISGYSEVETAALCAGAYGVAISGAGPTLLAITSMGQAATVAQEMQTAWKKAGVIAKAQVLQVNTTGATFQRQ
ncbi:homoserine kinase [Halothece sp. PCC 7418]|uniref:homoserine kinase n=1 Tax=Halothece sp. (strain PCC 7418) TaxID=65093 RepID=UPI0002A05CF2|nr:homoserine kinase [Halothece sp. PCC 7418]AFZ45635.1 homoserine kinase [Halothece sp. PCC 7418]